jgi:hypothetical protein
MSLFDLLLPLTGGAIIAAWWGVRAAKAGRWKTGIGVIFISGILVGVALFIVFIALTPIHKN